MPRGDPNRQALLGAVGTISPLNQACCWLFVRKRFSRVKSPLVNPIDMICHRGFMGGRWQYSRDLPYSSRKFTVRAFEQMAKALRSLISHLF
jgi:hypothetical protein